MRRRDFFEKSGMAVAAMGAMPVNLLGQDNSKKDSHKLYNILFIMTDQQFADAMSCAGNPYLNTPNMDKLAARGVRYTKAYCGNPICVPSRTSVFTGLYGHQNGIQLNTNDASLMKGDCLGRWMKEAGYRTAYVGKWHIPHEIQDKDWSGFEFVMEKNNGVDHLIADPSIDYIKQDDERPFFLVSSFVNPHDICEYARIESGIKDKLKNGEIGEVPSPESCPPLPFNYEIPGKEPAAIREHQAQETVKGTYPTIHWDSDKWRRYRWAYYRMIELVDAEIGKILDTLDDRKLWDNTLVVFTSDHGDGMGAHKWNQKTLFYDEVARIPLIICHPEEENPGRVEANRLINIGVDTAPTFLEMAGTKREELPGRSIFSPEKQEFIVVANHLFKAYGIEGKYSGRMIRTQQFKYSVYSGGKYPEVLIDMNSDPGEMHNLAYEDAYQNILSHHRQLLKNWIKNQEDSFLL